MAHLLGFTDLDDRGQEGLELVYESWLKGRSGSKRVHRDRLGREIEMLEGLQDMHPGQDVMLSLDQRLQYLAYRALKSSVKNNKAAAGAVVVLDIKTGEILAMVNQPTFNPNVRLRIRDGRYRNRALTDVFEPGSLMKTFSVVNALQYGAGRVRPDTVVDTSPGFWTVGHQVVKEDKNKNYGPIDLSMILQKSSNVGVSKLTLALPSEALINTYQHLGFGSATGSGFPGESAGSLTAPKNGSFTLATMSFGYGMNVTLLQLAQAYAVLGAEGIKKPVSFLKQEAPVLGEQVISPKVAREVIQMLTHVVEQGGGVKAKVAGYQVAGKTGTVRKIDKGVYQSNNHLALFAGVAPAINPRFAIAVMVDDPQGNAYYGSQVAAPIFSEIAMGALRLFNIAPDEMTSSGLRIAQISATISHE
jgi:cell division protein FtsI (penicillin-binding protein 3)